MSSLGAKRSCERGPALLASHVCEDAGTYLADHPDAEWQVVEFFYGPLRSANVIQNHFGLGIGRPSNSLELQHLTRVLALPRCGLKQLPREGRWCTLPGALPKGTRSRALGELNEIVRQA